VILELAYEPVSAELQSMVAGRVMSSHNDAEIKIEAEGGLWTSGWIKTDDGIFETPISLKEGAITTFWVYARDGPGRLLDIDTTEFKVRHGLVPSAPPLPHRLSVEILSPGGKAELGHASGGTPIGSIGVEVEAEAANSSIEHPNEVDRLGQIVVDAVSLVSCFLQHMRTP
jgi:hypothetical protein